jgi:hypothetical protein
MAIEVDELKPYAGKTSVDSALLRDAVIFDVRGVDSVVLQAFDAEGLGAWPTSLVLTVECSLDKNHFAAFPAGAVTFASFKVGEAIVVAGLSYLQVRVSTIGASGNGNIGVRANAVLEV